MNSVLFGDGKHYGDDGLEINDPFKKE